MNYLEARHNMVESQLKPNAVTDKNIVDVFRKVPRENFVPDAQKSICYLDEDIALKKGRYMLEPVVLGRMLQAAQIKPTDIVLDIGCLTGYSTAIISQLAETVIAIEEDSDLRKMADANLCHEDYCNTAVYGGSHKQGLPDQGAYDVIFIQGVADEIPDSLYDQLKEGGRLLAIEPNEQNITQVTLALKLRGSISKKALFDAFAHHLSGFEASKGFEF